MNLIIFIHRYVNDYLRMIRKVEVLNILKFNCKKLKLLNYLSNVKDLIVTLTHLLPNEFCYSQWVFSKCRIVRFYSTKSNEKTMLDRVMSLSQKIDWNKLKQLKLVVFIQVGKFHDDLRWVRPLDRVFVFTSDHNLTPIREEEKILKKYHSQMIGLKTITQ